MQPDSIEIVLTDRSFHLPDTITRRIASRWLNCFAAYALGERLCCTTFVNDLLPTAFPPHDKLSRVARHRCADFLLATKPRYSRHFKTRWTPSERKNGFLTQTGFDLVASNPRISPLAWKKEDSFMRVTKCREAELPPGGARLVNFRCQRFGRPFCTRHWPDSRGRIDFGHWNYCIAKHP